MSLYKRKLLRRHKKSTSRKTSRKTSRRPKKSTSRKTSRRHKKSTSLKTVNRRSRKTSRRPKKSTSRKSLKKHSKSLRKSLRKILKYAPPVEQIETDKKTKEVSRVDRILRNMDIYEETYQSSLNNTIDVLEKDLLGKVEKLNKDLIDDYKSLIIDLKDLHEKQTEGIDNCIKCIFNKTINIEEKIDELLKRYIKYFSNTEFKDLYKRYIKLYYNTSEDNMEIRETFPHEFNRPIERINKYKEFLNELSIIFRDNKFICRAKKELEFVEKCIHKEKYCDYEIRDEDIVCDKNRKNSVFY